PVVAFWGALEPLPEDLEMYVLDDGASVGERVVFYRPARDGSAETRPDESVALSDPIYGASLSFAGRDWTLVLRPSPRFVAAALAGAGATQLAAGLAVTLLLCIYLVSGRTRADRLALLMEDLRHHVGVRRPAQP